MSEKRIIKLLIILNPMQKFWVAVWKGNALEIFSMEYCQQISETHYLKEV